MTPTAHDLAHADSGLAAELRLAVARLSRRLRSERDAANELSVGQVAVLATLFRDGETTIGQLAALERVQPPSMTRTVTCLEEGGYVTRRPADDDRRQVVVSLAEKGADTLAADRRRRDRWLACRMRELSAEDRAVLRQVVPILERLANA